MCKCISEVNKELEPKGMELPVGLVHVDNTLQLALYIPLTRIDGGRLRKSDPKHIGLQFCPFCGEKIDRKAEAARLHADTAAAARKLSEDIPGALPMGAGRERP